MTPDPENLFEAIKHRRSMGLSKLKSEDVPRELIEKLLEAANWAPSHEDTEPWRFTVFSGEGRGKLADLFEAAYKADHPNDKTEEGSAGARKRAFAAPVWITIGVSPALKEDGSQKMSETEEVIAVACAVQNLHLMASSLGLAGMWHSKGVSVHPLVCRGLGLGETSSRLLGMFMCGWPSVDWTEGERGLWSDKVTWVESA
jgi:nitroreductase